MRARRLTSAPLWDAVKALSKQTLQLLCGGDTSAFLMRSTTNSFPDRFLLCIFIPQLLLILTWLPECQLQTFDWKSS